MDIEATTPISAITQTLHGTSCASHWIVKVPGIFECSICLGSINDGEAVATCHCDVGTHAFHPHCIKPWLSRARNCPVCQKKRSESTKARSRWKLATTWLLKRGRFRSRDTPARPLSSDTISNTVSKKARIHSPVKTISEPLETPTSRLIRRELKHFDSSGLPGRTDASSRSAPRSPQDRTTLSAGELSPTRPFQIPTQTRRWNSHSPTITTSTESNTRATTSESFEILPPMFDPSFAIYMNTRLEAIRQLREEDEKNESWCECLIS